MTGARSRPRSPRHTARWSQGVKSRSNALDLEPGVFTWHEPRAIALSLKHSADASRRRRSSPFRSAMSMLNFYINRAGAQLDEPTLQRLAQAKDELRALFGRPRHSPEPASGKTAAAHPSAAKNAGRRKAPARRAGDRLRPRA